MTTLRATASYRVKCTQGQTLRSLTLHRRPGQRFAPHVQPLCGHIRHPRLAAHVVSDAGMRGLPSIPIRGRLHDVQLDVKPNFVELFLDGFAPALAGRIGGRRAGHLEREIQPIREVGFRLQALGAVGIVSVRSVVRPPTRGAGSGKRSYLARMRQHR
jgi:hypothetical protein